jgi:hypothetical protein
MAKKSTGSRGAAPGSPVEDFVLGGWRPYVWVILAAVLPHLPVLGFGYSGLDDELLIVRDRTFLGDPSRVGEAFGRSVFDVPMHPHDSRFYRPLFTISLMVDMQRGGVDPGAYHFSNLLFHAAVCVLLLALLTRLGHARAPSLAAALLFAVHPIASMAVAWVPGRNDTLLALFVLASFLSYVAFLRSGSWKAATVHLMALTAALFTKESAAPLAVMCLFWRFAVHPGSGEAGAGYRPGRREAVVFVGWVVILAGWWTVRSGVVEALGLGIMIRSVVANLPALLLYVGKAVFPIEPSTYPTLADSSVIPGIAAIVLLAAAVVFTRRRRVGAILFGAGWFLLFLFPSFVTADGPVAPAFFEHRMYLPLVGIFLILLETDAVRKLAARPGRLAAVTAIPFVAFAVLTVLHDRDFSDNLRLWRNAARTSPSNVQAHLTLGARYGESRRFDEAERAFRRAYELDPDHRDVHFNLGVLYRDRREYDRSEEMFRKEVELHPDHAGAHFYLGLLERRKKNTDEAIRLWKRTVELDPTYVRAYEFLAMAYCERKDVEESRRWVRELERRGGVLSPRVRQALGPCL